MKHQFRLTMNSSELFVDNISNTTGDNEENLWDIQFAIYVICNPVVITFGYIGNIATAIVLWQSKMASITNLFLRALVVSDMALVTFASLGMTLPTLVTKLVNKDLGIHVIIPHGFKAIDYLTMTSQLCNVYVVVFVAIERYIAICHPMKHVYIHSKTKVLSSIAGILIFAVCYNLPRVASTEIALTSCFDEKYPYDCFEIRNTDFGSTFSYKSVYAVWMYTVVCFGIPILTLMVLNIMILRKLSEMRIRRRTLEAYTSRVKKDNTTIVIVLIVTVFTICQTLGFLNQFQYLIDDTKDNASVQTNITVIINFLFMINSSTNFIIYICVGRKFRQVFMQTFCSKKWNCRASCCCSCCCWSTRAYDISNVSLKKLHVDKF
ncbi:FMRFamide receptor-like [Argopecten irradians]|uniref:FMRFamide receptor-like n=1 Tax=Argopecten irradians TaxID=31199 RepID=UPI0037131903